MQVNQPAEIELDAYPDLQLMGHVQSIGAGTGSEFSVIPAQNANGNWVKVTQRIPVRIAIDSKSSRPRSEEHTSELQSLMRSSYAVFCLKKKNKNLHTTQK